MKEDAVSPVIAFMLLLTIIVSFIALLNANYIPGLKQQAEVEHIQAVEQSFLSLSSDIDRMVTFGQSGSVVERIPLGGGDVQFSPLRSAGTLQVDDLGWVARMTTTNASGESRTDTLSLVNITYQPVGNFWQEQGYVWDTGTILVTKGGRNSSGLFARSAYLSLNNETAAQDAKTGFVSTLLGVPSVTHTGDNITNISLSPGNFSLVPGKGFLSGNGIGSIKLVQTGDPEGGFLSCESILIAVNPEYPLASAVLEKYYETFNTSFTYNGKRYANCSLGAIAGNSFQMTFTGNLPEVQVNPRKILFCVE